MIAAGARKAIASGSAIVEERSKEPPRQLFVDQPLLCCSVVVGAPEDLLGEDGAFGAVGGQLAL